MPRTAVNIVDAPFQKEIDNLTTQAGDNTNGMEFSNSGREVIIVRNPTAGALTMTVVSVADKHGRTGDLSVVVPAAGTGFVGPLQPDLFNQAGTGKVHLNFSATGLTIAILRVRV
jgi:P pilus assembly chaperone PapD